MLSENTAIYQTVRVLPEHERPVVVFRKDGKTIVAMDPRDRRVDISLAMGDSLTIDEHNAFRAGWGVGPIGTETDLIYTNTDPCLLYVPRPLRLHGEPALQGGTELERRFIADDIDIELALLGREQHSQAG